MSAATMAAITRDRYGTPAVLRLREIERPAAGAGDVVVRVKATSVNAADRFLLRGEPYLIRLMSGVRRPKRPVPGADLAGVVEQIGAGVTRFRPGDEVYAEAEAGAYAEYVRVPEKRLAAKPANLTFEQAAAVPMAACTALQGLRDAGRVQPGQRLLVNGASGGVGTFAVQIGKALGAEVTGVCSTRNVDLVRSIGADRVIDYTREDFAGGAERYDVIFDLAGNRSLADYRRALTPTGALVLSSGNGGRWLGPMGRLAAATALSPFVRQRLVGLVASASATNLAFLTGLIESGAVTPVIERSFPLAETAEAIRYIETEHARAKVVITV